MAHKCKRLLFTCNRACCSGCMVCLISTNPKSANEGEAQSVPHEQPECRALERCCSKKILSCYHWSPNRGEANLVTFSSTAVSPPIRTVVIPNSLAIFRFLKLQHNADIDNFDIESGSGSVTLHAHAKHGACYLTGRGYL